MMPQIARVETFRSPPRSLLVRVETTCGHVGWGEATLEGRTRTVAAELAWMGEYLIGKDPRRIEDHRRVLCTGGFYRGGPVIASAAAGIDLALWDLTGRWFGAAVHEMLGGAVRDRVRVYAWIEGDTPAELAAAAKARVREGYSAVKLTPLEVVDPLPTPRDRTAAVERVAAVREAVGDAVDVAVDLHGRVDAVAVRQWLAALAPYDPLFVEEPVPPDQLAALPALAGVSPSSDRAGRTVARSERVSVGTDRWRTHRSAGRYARRRNRRAGSNREAWQRSTARCLLRIVRSDRIAFAASLQVALCSPAHLMQEQHLEVHAGHAWTGAPVVRYDTALELVGGAVAVPRSPGLGIDVDEESVRAGSHASEWATPRWRHADGTHAEW